MAVEGDHDGSVQEPVEHRDDGGWLTQGCAVTVDHQHKKVKVGYDYVHSLVDDHSRLAYSEILLDEREETCAAFLERAAAYFAGKVTTRIGQVMADNAFAYRHSNHMRRVCGVCQINGGSGLARC